MRVEGAWTALGERTHPRERCHDNAVRQLQRANLEGIEECGHLRASHFDVEGSKNGCSVSIGYGMWHALRLSSQRM
jgi:hypothetical protein